MTAMTPLYSLVLASLVSITPPALPEAPSPELTVGAPHVEPLIDATALERFVREAAARYEGE